MGPTIVVTTINVKTKNSRVALVRFVELDLGRAEMIQKTAAFIEKEFQRLDIIRAIRNRENQRRATTKPR
jgi:hypothetical protein